MALLHSEVSEALEAWRVWGLADNTSPPVRKAVLTESRPRSVEVQDVLPKPEGVGSEFADILIRLLDDAWLFGEVDLEAGARRIAPIVAGGSFPADMNVLHDLISLVSHGPVGGSLGYEELWAGILVFLRQLCEKYGIDLEAEYERKMAYNRTRPRRHGNKRI
jgi:hypothetical protein